MTTQRLRPRREVLQAIWALRTLAKDYPHLLQPAGAEWCETQARAFERQLELTRRWWHRFTDWRL